MAQTLDDLLHELVARGELTHLSVAKVGPGFSASFAHASSQGVSIVTAADPVRAIRDAIDKVKLARKSPAKPAADDLDFG